MNWRAGVGRLFEELRLVQHALGQRLGVLGHALGVVGAGRLDQLGGEGVGRRDRHRRALGVDLERRHVELELGPHRLQIEAGDHPQILQRQRELDRQPVAPLPHHQQPLLVADHQLGHRLDRVDVDLEVDRQPGPVRQADVGRAVQGRLGDALPVVDRVDLAAADVLALEGEKLRGVERELAGRADRVGRAHAAELVAGGARGREVGRHANDPALHAVLLQHLPERRAVAQQLDRAPGRHLPAADAVAVLGGLGAAGRQVGQHGLGVAVHEVEDAVAAGVHAGDEVRPGHRALRRHRGPERREAAGLGQPRQVGQLALGHQPRGHAVVHAVEAEHDHPLAAVAGRAAAAGRQQAQTGRRQDRPDDPAPGGATLHQTPHDGSPGSPFVAGVSEQRAPLHVRCRLEPEQLQRRRRDVDQGRVRRSSIGRLQKSTPGTWRGSTQWSPLQALTLSSKTGPATTPVAQSHEAR